MSKIARGAGSSFIAMMSILGALVSVGSLCEQVGAQEGFSVDTCRLALIDQSAPEEVYNEPLASSVMTVPTDAIPPFLAHPDLQSIADLSFDENQPQRSNSVLELPGQSIDECCQELSNMIAGNLDSEMSLESKKKMIEMALKMVARNVALKAEARLTLLEANHALERSQFQAQITSLRSTSNAPMQIQRVMAPVYRALDRNYLQATSSNQAFSQVAERLDSMQRSLAANEAPQRRPTIRLTSQLPQPTNVDSESRISQRIAELENQLVNMRAEKHNQRRPAPANRIRQA